MDGPKVYYAKSNKSDRESQIQHGVTHLQNLKESNKPINKTRQKQTTRNRNQKHACQEGLGVDMGGKSEEGCSQ